jgi:signal transduction histidine kinase
MNQRLVSGFWVTVGILVVMGWFSYTSIREFSETSKVVARSNAYLSALERLLTNVVSAESEVRGFVIMGNEDYLTLYNVLVSEVDAGLSRLIATPASKTSDETEEKLAQLIRARMERLRMSIDARRRGGLDEAVSLAGVGKRLMDELRGLADNIYRMEQNALSDAAKRLDLISVRSTWIISVGSLLAVTFSMVSTLAIGRAESNRRILERALLEISEREQRRIGQDLHDGLCQQLTGIALMVRGLQGSVGEAARADAAAVLSLINGCIEETRLVTRGLHPVSEELGGLMVGLRELVEGTRSATDIDCCLEVPAALTIRDESTGTNLYRIAQEAMRNAVKHASPQRIAIRIGLVGDQLRLEVEDDGAGIRLVEGRRGLGLEIMRYRAASIGGSLTITSREGGGTVVRCIGVRI